LFVTRAWWVSVLLLISVQAAVAQTPTATPGVCPGDCNHDGVVTIAEKDQAIAIINGADLSTCPAADVNGDGRVRANEITIIINTITNGQCGPRVGPQLLHNTPTPTIAVTCPCDCDSNGIVTESEKDIAVDIINGIRPLTDCPQADVNQDGQVRANEITQCINAIVSGPCALPRYLPGCAGDCNNDGLVVQSEIQTMTDIVNGLRPFSDCPNGDGNGDGQIRAADITIAINALNYSCAYDDPPRLYFSLPPPTGTPTPTVVPTAYVVPVLIGHTKTPTPSLAIVVSTPTPFFTLTGTPTATSTPTPTEIICGSYSDVVMDDDPRVYYLLDEPSGATIAKDRMHRHDGLYAATDIAFEEPGCCVGQATPEPTPTPGTPFFAHGCYTGDNTDDRDIAVGFRPSLVWLGEATVANGNTNKMSYRDRTHADGESGVLQTGLGNGNQTNAIQSFGDTTFQIGTSTLVNGLGRPYCWAAWQEAPDYMEVGQFAGDAAPNHQIPTGFTPDVAVVHPVVSTIFNRIGTPFLRTTAMGTGDFSCVWANASAIECKDGGITALLSSPFTGFSISNFGPVWPLNHIGGEHHYAVLKEHTNYLDFGIYTGDGLIGGNTQTITTDCPAVAAVFIRGVPSNNTCSMWRSSSMETPYVTHAGFAMGVNQPGGNAGGIRPLAGNTGEFTIEKGSSSPDADCNVNNTTYFWWAMCEGPSPTATPTVTITPTPTHTGTPTDTPNPSFTQVCESRNNAAAAGTGWTVDTGTGTVVTGYNTTGPSNVLKLQNLGFAIPPGSTILGIEVDMGGGGPRNGLTSSFLPVTTVCDSWTTSPRDTIVQLLDANGDPVGDNKATGSSWPPTGNSVLFPDGYGGATDLWGSTWDAATINDTSFGVQVQVDWASSNDETDCDQYWTVEFADPDDKPDISAGLANITVCYEGIAPTATETPTPSSTPTPTPTGMGCSTYSFDVGFECLTTFTTTASGGSVDWGGDCSTAISASVSSGAAGTTYLLKIAGGTLTAGDPVPGSATIDGIRLTSGMGFTHSDEFCEPIMWDAAPQDNVVRLVNAAGTVVGTDKGNDATIIQGTIYGGLADDWSASLTGADFAGDDFGFAFQSTFDATTNTADDCGGTRGVVFSTTTMEVCWHE